MTKWSRSLGWWQRGIVSGAFFGISMVVFWLVQGTGFWIALLGGLLTGALFGLFMAPVYRRLEHQLDPPDGPPLTPHERSQLTRAIRTGKLPDDPRIRAATLTAAERLTRQREGPVAAGILFGSLALLAAVTAILVHPLAWLLVAVLVMFTPAMIVVLHRQQARTRTLLEQR